MTCSFDGCNRKKFKTEDYCVLHNEKREYGEDRDKGVLSGFYNELIDYVVQYFLKYNFNSHRVSFSAIKDYLEGKANHNVFFATDKEIRFTEIKFPDRDSRDTFDYFLILKKLKKIHFDRCCFMARSLNLPKLELFYQDCEFLNHWSLTNSNILKNVNGVLYQNCTFYKNVSAFTHDDFARYSFDVTLFNDCTFTERLELDNCHFKASIFNNTRDWTISINRIEISNSVVESPFILNNAKISFVLLKDSVFKSKFEFKDGKVEEARIDNSNFEKIFDSFNTKYDDFQCVKSIFSDFVGFEGCVFSKPEEKNIVKFQYATFLGFVSFRKAIFNSGLCIEEANFKEPPNFLNVEIEKGRTGEIQTSRETFRIIKHSFDKVGNKIEGNSFYAYEMQKYLQELSKDKKKNWAELIVFKTNNCISRFGQSYIRPIFFYLLTVVTYYLLTLVHEGRYICRLLSPSLNSLFSSVSKHLNGFASNILPFKSFLRPGMESLSLLFYIVFIVLTWQLVVSIKRHTTR